MFIPSAKFLKSIDTLYVDFLTVVVFDREGAGFFGREAADVDFESFHLLDEDEDDEESAS